MERETYNGDVCFTSVVSYDVRMYRYDSSGRVGFHIGGVVRKLKSVELIKGSSYPCCKPDNLCRRRDHKRTAEEDLLSRSKSEMINVTHCII